MENEARADDVAIVPIGNDNVALSEAAQLSESHSMRLMRLLDYQSLSLKMDDPLDANLGSINSGLMLIAMELEQTINRAMKSGPRTLESLARILPAIDTHLRMVRQVDRFSQISLKRSAEARKMRDDKGAKLLLDAPSTVGSESEVFEI